jgi:hypothetical protein
MKKLLLSLTLLFSPFIFLSGCTKEEENDDPCEVVKIVKSVGVSDGGSDLSDMKQAATDDREFYWEINPSDVCNSQSVDVSYAIWVRKSKPDINVKMVFTYTDGSGLHVMTPNMKSDYDGSETDVLYDAKISQQKICEGCPKGATSFLARIIVNVDPAAGDPVEYMQGAISLLTLKGDYIEY